MLFIYMRKQGVENVFDSLFFILLKLPIPEVAVRTTSVSYTHLTLTTKQVV